MGTAKELLLQRAVSDSLWQLLAKELWRLYVPAHICYQQGIQDMTGVHAHHCIQCHCVGLHHAWLRAVLLCALLQHVPGLQGIRVCVEQHTGGRQPISPSSARLLVVPDHDKHTRTHEQSHRYTLCQC
jgi:hypothetical protein